MRSALKSPLNVKRDDKISSMSINFYNILFFNTATIKQFRKKSIRTRFEFQFRNFPLLKNLFVSRFYLASKNTKEKIFLATGDGRSSSHSSGSTSTIHLPSFLLINREGISKMMETEMEGSRPRHGLGARSSLERVIHRRKYPRQHDVVHIEIVFMVSVPRKESKERFC